MSVRAPIPRPPGGPRVLLRLVLPCDPMGHAIVGDLHEEFCHDVAHLGLGGARARYWRLALGIVAYSLWDSLRWKSWSSSPADGETDSVQRDHRVNRPAIDRHLDARRGRIPLRRLGGRMALVALAFGVLGLMVVMNSTVFAAVEGSPHAVPQAQAAGPPLVLAVLGIVSLLALVGCAVVAAILMCVGPGWDRRRASVTQAS